MAHYCTELRDPCYLYHFMTAAMQVTSIFVTLCSSMGKEGVLDGTSLTFLILLSDIDL